VRRLCHSIQQSGRRSTEDRFLSDARPRAPSLFTTLSASGFLAYSQRRRRKQVLSHMSRRSTARVRAGGCSWSGFFRALWLHPARGTHLSSLVALQASSGSSLTFEPRIPHSPTSLTAYPRRHETLFLDWNAEFRFAESRFSQPLYQ